MPGLSWLTPPSLGRIWILLFYWISITIMITNKAIIHDAYYWERVGFRAAWISVTQVPFVLLLAGKVNIIGYLIGSSHEQLNWLHRWVARTLFISVTVHGSFFLAEWVRADFVSLELATMPMVKYGMGAWCVLLWINLSSLAPVRGLGYELFVFQHLTSAIIFLWLLWKHVPLYAMYNVWIAIGFLVFDRVAYSVWFAALNLLPRKGELDGLGGIALPRRKRSRLHQLNWKLGHRAYVEAHSGDITTVTLKNTSMSYRPGQHLYLWIPRVGGIESHPYTISNAQRPFSETASSGVRLVIRSHSGFSRRLYKRARDAAQNGGPTAMTAFIVGPFGSPPLWHTYETVILIAASTGASFTLPVFESLIQDLGCVSQIRFLFLVSQRQQCLCYLSRLEKVASQARSLTGVSSHVEIAVSREFSDSPGGGIPPSGCTCHSNASRASSENGASSDTEKIAMVMGSSSCHPQPCCPAPVHLHFGKRDLLEYIRSPVETAYGETLVAVCGGKRLTSDVRNLVTRLSDERAVHKGSGAQGIRLYVEEYAF